MWIKGRRRGGAKDLTKHLLRTDENESVTIREIAGFTFDKPTKTNLDKALHQMEAIGYGKGAKRNLYHVILAPAYGETLTAEQRKYMIDDYAKQMGFQDHQRVVMEHWKKGKQHFHVVFNIIHPTTGKIHELKWTKRKEWDISRGLEKALGLSTPVIKGKAAKASQMQRGKRSGIDPRKMRKEITAIYHSSKTTKDFIAALDKAGCALTRGRRDQLVLVDKVGDTHGLMRMIEGKKLSDLRKKFEGIEKIDLPLHADLVKSRKPIRATRSGKASFHHRTRRTIYPSSVRSNVRNAYRHSKTGAAFCHTLNRHGYALGKGRKSYAAIDANGHKHGLSHLLGRDAAIGLHKTFPDLAHLHIHPASTIIRRLKAEHSRTTGATSGRSNRAHLPSPAVANASLRKTRPQKGTRGSSPSISKIGSSHGTGGDVAKSTGGSGSSIAAAILALFQHASREATKHWREQQHSAPLRPVGHGAMSKAQLDDLQAAIEGKISWAEYFKKWGGGGPTL